MARTYKRLGRNERRPGGWRRAKIAGCKPDKTPPDSWEHPPCNDHCFIPFRAAWRLHQKGLPRDLIVKKLKWRFKLTEQEAREAIPDSFYWKCKCEVCNENAPLWWKK